jgi:hypothetical protein
VVALPGSSLVRRHLKRPSPALVVAVVALSLSVAGNAAAAVIISSNGQVAQGTIAGHKPPSGAHANIIKGSINGVDLAPLPAWREVGAAGQPAFTSGSGCGSNCFWQNSGGSDTTAAFYRFDGVVSLKGQVCNYYEFPPCISGTVTGDAVIFTLPTGYRPAHTVMFQVPTGPTGIETATVYVLATGDVVARDFDEKAVRLDGISFRLDS